MSGMFGYEALHYYPNSVELPQNSRLEELLQIDQWESHTLFTFHNNNGCGVCYRHTLSINSLSSYVICFTQSYVRNFLHQSQVRQDYYYHRIRIVLPFPDGISAWIHDLDYDLLLEIILLFCNSRQDWCCMEKIQWRVSHRILHINVCVKLPPPSVLNQ